MWIILTRSKDEAFEAFLKVKAATEMELQLQVCSCALTEEGNLFQESSIPIARRKGLKDSSPLLIHHSRTELSERRNQTVVAMVCSLLKSKSLPNTFWGEEVTTAVYLLNQAPLKSVPDKTPYEAFYGREPYVAHLRTFGCVGHVKKATTHLTKLEDRSTKMVFIGYETSAHSKAYPMYDPVANKVHISQDVVFEEDKAWAWSSEPAGKDNTSEPFIVDFSTHIDACVELPHSGDDSVLDARQDNVQIEKDDSIFAKTCTFTSNAYAVHAGLAKDADYKRDNRRILRE
jgi:hypothetical protein